MAEEKKAVLLYCDIITTVEKLSNEDAGLLFKHYLRYINDKSPEPPSTLIDLVFEPIKQNLKRDLKKWESIICKRSEAGKLSAEKRKQQNSTNSTSVESVKQSSTNPTVIVKDTVTVNVTDTVKVNDISKTKNLIEFFFKDLENSKYLHEIAVNNKIELEYVRDQIPEFRKKADLEYPTYMRFVNHFKNFVVKGLNKPSGESKVSVILSIAEQQQNELKAKYK